jgi:hypothetical protein
MGESPFETPQSVVGVTKWYCLEVRMAAGEAFYMSSCRSKLEDCQTEYENSVRVGGAVEKCAERATAFCVAISDKPTRQKHLACADTFTTCSLNADMLRRQGYHRIDGTCREMKP